MLAVLLAALAVIGGVNVHPVLRGTPAAGPLIVVAEVLAFAGVAVLLLAAALALVLRSAITPDGVDARRAASAERIGRWLRSGAAVLIVAGPVMLALALLASGSGWKVAVVALIASLAPYALLFVAARQVHKLGRGYAGAP